MNAPHSFASIVDDFSTIKKATTSSNQLLTEMSRVIGCYNENSLAKLESNHEMIEAYLGIIKAFSGHAIEELESLRLSIEEFQQMGRKM
jgi:hypothetical protein